MVRFELRRTVDHSIVALHMMTIAFRTSSMARRHRSASRSGCQTLRAEVPAVPKWEVNSERRHDDSTNLMVVLSTSTLTSDCVAVHRDGVFVPTVAVGDQRQLIVHRHCRTMTETSGAPQQRGMVIWPRIWSSLFVRGCRKAGKSMAESARPPSPKWWYPLLLGQMGYFPSNGFSNGGRHDGTGSVIVRRHTLRCLRFRNAAVSWYRPVAPSLTTILAEH